MTPYKLGWCHSIEWAYNTPKTWQDKTHAVALADTILVVMEICHISVEYWHIQGYWGSYRPLIALMSWSTAEIVKEGIFFSKKTTIPSTNTTEYVLDSHFVPMSTLPWRQSWSMITKECFVVQGEDRALPFADFTREEDRTYVRD